MIDTPRQGGGGERRTRDSLAEEKMYNLAQVKGLNVTQSCHSARLSIQVDHLTSVWRKRDGGGWW